MPPEVVSHYQVLESLGRGGMGDVFRGRDLRLGRIVALKFLSPDRLRSQEDRARFLIEARALSSLNHPHIATVYEVDESNGTPFMAMEYLAGGTLRARMAQAEASGGHLPFQRLVAWGVGLAEALEHAHSRGVVHRDVKTSNVMFDERDCIKLMDFGLAKIAGAPAVSAPDVIAGTMAYMAPEQISGHGADVRSDLYSLGVVLYESATGVLPFPAQSPGELVERILHERPSTPCQVRTGLPAGFDRVVGRLMAKKPGDRYQSATDVVRDLESLDMGRVDPASLPTEPRASRPFRDRSARRRWATWAGLGLAAALAVGIVLHPRPPPLPERKHLLVLPIRCIGADERQQVFCDGLTETLTTILSQVGAFYVVPASETRRLADVEQARQEFGVNLVLYASLQRSGESARLTLNLIDADSKRTLRAETIQGPVQRLYELEDGVLATVADLVGFAVPRAGASPLATVDAHEPAAIDAYLRGRGLLFRYDRPGNLARALAEFEEAIRLDPSLAAAHVGIAEVHLRTYRSRNEPETLAAARASAERALALTPNLAVGRVVLGAILAESDDLAEAEKQLQLALADDDRDPAAQRELAAVYKSQGRFDEAERVYRQAIRARPGDWESSAELAKFLYDRQRYAEAAEVYQEVIEVAPDSHIGYRNLGGVYMAMGKNVEAEAMLKKAQSIHPTSRGLSNLGTLYMFERRYTDALPVLKQAAELAAKEAPSAYRIWGNLGDAHWLAGSDPAEARAAWQKAAQIAETLLVQRPKDSVLEAILAEYRAKLGDRDRARAHIGAAESRSPQSSFVHYQAGVVYAILKDDATAVRELLKALDLGDVKEDIRRSPELADLRGSPAFKDVGDRVAATP